MTNAGKERREAAAGSRPETPGSMNEGSSRGRLATVARALATVGAILSVVFVGLSGDWNSVAAR